MFAVLGNQVSSDLELSTISISTITKWGQDTFQNKLVECNTDPMLIRRSQLPLLVLTSEPSVRAYIRSQITSINPNIESIDECFDTNDARIQELLTQILWKPTSYTAFLNKSPLVLNSLITWKTLILPGFSILMPMLLMIVPYFIQKCIDPTLEVHHYLEHFKEVILKQISIPSVLKSRGSEDRVGFFLESLFIGLTLAMFISSLWNQISTSLHLRAIWHDIDDRGAKIRQLRETVETIVQKLLTLSIKKQRGVKHILEMGERLLDNTKEMIGLDNVSTFGLIWNNPKELLGLKEWIGLIDVLVSISELPNICYPKLQEKTGFDICDVYHPSLTSCVRNSIRSDGHAIITGPNRGGKSTFCKTIGLAIITAQSWGFAFARKMTFSPFHTISTVLEPCGKLGVASTFESEIEFAKAVLATTTRPMFVMMDEIFHSTNALDGVAASRVFLKQMYKLPDTISIVSTHYVQLASEFNHDVMALQLLTNDKSDSTLEYTYKVAPGISHKSSVMEILKERGLSPT